MNLKVTPEYTKEKNTDRDRAVAFARQLETELNQWREMAEELAKPTAHTANQLSCHCFCGLNQTTHKDYCNIGLAIKTLTKFNQLKGQAK